jgi:hypothetical protein
LTLSRKWKAEIGEFERNDWKLCQLLIICFVLYRRTECIGLKRKCHAKLCWLPNLKEQLPSWGANMCEVSQEIFPSLWNSLIHYGVHEIRPVASVLSLINPILNLLLCLVKIYFNIIFSCMHTSSKWYYLHRSLDFKVYISHFLVRVTSHPPWFDLPNNIWWRA